MLFPLLLFLVSMPLVAMHPETVLKNSKDTDSFIDKSVVLVAIKQALALDPREGPAYLENFCQGKNVLTIKKGADAHRSQLEGYIKEHRYKERLKQVLNEINAVRLLVDDDRTDLLRLLVRYGALVTLPDENGNTPLAVAIKKDHADCKIAREKQLPFILTLLDNGATLEEIIRDPKKNSKPVATYITERIGWLQSQLMVKGNAQPYDQLRFFRAIQERAAFMQQQTIRG